MNDETAPRGRGRPPGVGPRQQEAVRVGEAMAVRLAEAQSADHAEVIAEVRAVGASIARGCADLATLAQAIDAGGSNGGQDDRALARLESLATALRQALAGIWQIQGVAHETSRSVDRSRGDLARMIDDLRTSLIGDLTTATRNADQQHEELRAALLQQGALGQVAIEAAASNAAALAALDQDHRLTAETLARLPTEDDLKSVVAHAVGEAELGAVKRHDEVLRTVAKRDVEHSVDRRVAGIVARALTTPGLKDQMVGEMMKTIAANAPEILAQSTAARNKAVLAALDSGIRVEAYLTAASDPAGFVVARYDLSGEIVVYEKADGALDVWIAGTLVTHPRSSPSPAIRAAAQAAMAAVHRYKAEVVAHETARRETASTVLLAPQKQPDPLDVADPQKRGVGPHFRAQGASAAERPSRRFSFTPPLRRT